MDKILFPDSSYPNHRIPELGDSNRVLLDRTANLDAIPVQGGQTDPYDEKAFREQELMRR